MKNPKMTVIGGGTGISIILKAFVMSSYITAVVTVADDGGSSGELRNAMQLAPPGDLRNVLLAMSDMPKFYERVFQYRFNESDGALAGHPLGNLIIAGISEMQGSNLQCHSNFNQIFPYYR
ncbi:transporter [Streptococcus pyogenes]|nr:transporter [Streptococcus pyogenes]